MFYGTHFWVITLPLSHLAKSLYKVFRLVVDTLFFHVTPPQLKRMSLLNVLGWQLQ